MAIAVLGLNHKSSRLELREIIQRNIEDSGNAYPAVLNTAGCENLVVLSTCNRIEFYFTCSHIEKTVQKIEKLLLPHHEECLQEFQNSFYLFQDEDAIRHCFTVAPGLDSMILGEPEILGQMKQAFQKSRELGMLQGPLLRLFEKAFQTAKEVRSETDIGKGSIGTASVSMALAQKVCGALVEKSILILGAGKFSEKLMMHLVRHDCRNITIATRRMERGQELANRYPIRVIPFSEWTHHLEQTDLLISATTHAETLLSFGGVVGVMSKRAAKPLCLIDLAVPRTVAPEVSKIANVHLYNIEDLKGIGYQNLKFRENAMAQAYAIIHARAKTFLMELQTPDVAALVPKLNQLVRECIRREVGPALEPYLGSENERKTVAQAISQMERNLSHKLLMRIKNDLMGEENLSTGSLFAKIFQDELAQVDMPDALKQYPDHFLEGLRKRFHQELHSLASAETP